MLCEYGCGEEAKYQLKNGKWCCSKHYQSCKGLKKKNSISNSHRTIEEKKRIGSFGMISNNKKTACKFCGKSIAITGIKLHEKWCYLNPIRKKICPICGKPIKNYKTNKTCSNKCGVYLGKNPECISITKQYDLNYRSICFNYHEKKCIICGEEIFIEVHHVDGDRSNNNPFNLVPLCPTHHKYIHHEKYCYIVKECIYDYINEKMNIKNQNCQGS